MDTKKAIDNVDGIYAQVEGTFCCSTKEAIELVEKAFGTWEDEYDLSEETTKGMNEVIALLKRGERFEKIVEELEDFCDKANGIIRINEDEWFTWKLNKIIEKYFPKKEVLK